jgi:hypothetical protein
MALMRKLFPDVMISSATGVMPGAGSRYIAIAKAWSDWRWSLCRNLEAVQTPVTGLTDGRETKC